MNLCLFNPGVEDNQGHPSSNLGDLLIEKAVLREVKAIFPEAQLRLISTQVYPQAKQLRALAGCQVRIVGGTNLLSSNMDSYCQWKIKPLDAAVIRKAILMGVGWWQYQEPPNEYTRKLLRRALSIDALHSVRDSYTEDKLRSIGMHNVINTGCPTMWPFARVGSDDIPRQKAPEALLMLTDYSQEPELDKRLTDLLLANYRTVYYWPQGRNDLELVAGCDSRLVRLESSVAALEAFIGSGKQFDYVGTRLHGGIICLLARKRSLILEVDNRAREIARDTGLTTCERDNFEFMTRWIAGPTETHVSVDEAAIGKWVAQFKAAEPGREKTVRRHQGRSHGADKRLAKLPAPAERLVNLGCGASFHPGWVNLDFVPQDPAVIRFDLREKLPFEDASCAVVYHSHVLEHFTHAFAPKFLRECHRILQRGGILRVVVPDLETIARLYLRKLESAAAGDETAARQYEWMQLELLDQLVREQSGGEMLKYWQQDPMPAGEFVLQRVGSEALRGREGLLKRDQSAEMSVPLATWAASEADKNVRAPSGREIGEFRNNGEVHKWMYDRYSLAVLLRLTGFREVKVCPAHESRIPNFTSYHLDVSANGKVRKPDSLFMEGLKP